MFRHEMPDEYVIGTRAAHSIEEFANKAFAYGDLDREKQLLIDPAYSCPTEISELRADTTKVKNKLNWVPKIDSQDFIKFIVDADLELIEVPAPSEGKMIVIEKGFHWLQRNPCP